MTCSRCSWCRSLLEQTRAGQRFCSQRCRQAAWRARRLRSLEAIATSPKAFAYADPPYPGLARRYYQHEPDYAGEVDHRELIQRLCDGWPDGWALSTSAEALRDVLPMCPQGADVCPWVKPIGASPLTFGRHNTWEPLIVYGGRQRRGGVRDWLSAQPARHGGTLPGRKPLAFARWLFELLGMTPGDTITELYPGTRMVGRAWEEISHRPGTDATESCHLREGATRSSAPMMTSRSGSADGVAEDLSDG